MALCRRGVSWARTGQAAPVLGKERMMWLQPLRRLVSLLTKESTSRRRRLPRPRRPVRLGVERLEDRTVPSTTLYVTNTNDSANFTPGDGSLRGEVAAAQ